MRAALSILLLVTIDAMGPSTGTISAMRTKHTLVAPGIPRLKASMMDTINKMVPRTAQGMNSISRP